MVSRFYDSLDVMEDVCLINFRISSSGYRELERNLVKGLVEEAVRETNKGFPGINLGVTVTLRTFKDDEFAQYDYRTKEISLNGPKLEEEPQLLEWAFYLGISKAVAKKVCEYEGVDQHKDVVDAYVLSIHNAFMTKEMGKDKVSNKGKGRMYLYKATITRVIDGDTFDAIVDLGFRMTTKQRLRLVGIQVPELASKEGKVAKQCVEDILATVDYKVQVATEKTGSFGRWLATVYVPQNLNKLLIENGIAEEYKR